jgi:hypothetical protein
LRPDIEFHLSTDAPRQAKARSKNPLVPTQCETSGTIDRPSIVAGFVNVARIKGGHNAIKTAMLAAEATFERLLAGSEGGGEITVYPVALRASSVCEDLRKL